MRAIELVVGLWVLASPSLAHAAGGQKAAEDLAARASAQCQAGEAAAGEALARKALALTAEFEPTDYVRAGRKGEVVEDAFLDARRQYRVHRARIFEAVGSCLARAGRHQAAGRYLGRAALLQPSPARALAHARALLAGERPAEALAALRPAVIGAAAPDPEALRVLEQAADAARLASAQVTLDRWRVQAMGAPGAAHVAGPLPLAPGARLSTGAPFALPEEPVIVYVAPVSCRDCSAHLQEIGRTLTEHRQRMAKEGGPDVHVLLVPEEPDQDHALRQVAALYRYDWPVLLGRGHAAALGVVPGQVLVVARRGWSAVQVKPPFEGTLGRALAVLVRRDVTETLPRSNWNRAPAPPDAAPPAPRLLPEGLAPGEDAPAPAAFTAAVDAFRAGRALEALRFLDSLGADPGGWLLPPEARFNRALALRAAGERAAARRILLRIGDSRFQEEVDRALEAQPPR